MLKTTPLVRYNLYVLTGGLMGAARHYPADAAWLGVELPCQRRSTARAFPATVRNSKMVAGLGVDHDLADRAEPCVLSFRCLSGFCNVTSRSRPLVQ